MAPETITIYNSINIIYNRDVEESKSMAEDNNKQSDESAKRKRKREKNRGEFKVVFKGLLREGFSKEQVLTNIVQLTKLPEDKIEQKFFSGKAVIIRRAHDLMHAQKLQQLFFNAGLEVVILEDTEIKKQVEKVVPEKTKKDVLTQELKKTIKTRKRTLLAIMLWVVLIAIAVNLWNEFDISVEVPDDVISIEQSLANESLVFLAHVDIERLLSLHHYFVDDPNALPGVESNLYNDLKKSGIDPQQSIRQMVIAAYMSNKEAIVHTILLGEFSVAAVKRFLIKHYHGKVIPDSEFVRLQIAELDPVTCKKANFKEVAIEADRILIATEGHLDELRRLLAKPPGNVTDMTNWADYRRDKLVSLALFKPQKGTQLATGLPAMMAKDVVRKNKPLSSLFAGIGMQLLPPGAVLDISLNSQDPDWLQKTRTTMETHIADMRNQSQGLGNLLTLLDKVSVHEQDSQVSLNLLMDSELKKSIALSLQEWSDKFFSMESSGTKQGAQPATEKINKQPVTFKGSYAAANLKPFSTQLDQFFKPTWSDGPFAVAIEELLLEGEQVSLQLRAKGQNIDNVGNRHAKINVLAVQNRQGKNVLQQSGCGVMTNRSDDSYFSLWGGSRTAYVNNKPVQFNELEARKKVKLKPGTNFNEVTSLQARIELDLATRTRKEQLSKAQTDKNKVLTAYGSRIFFKPSAGDTLSYTVSGDEQRILAVRALNKNKQYLSRSSSTSMANIWGGGRSVSQSYHGEVAFVEVVYAEALSKSTYDVSIDRFPPYYSDEQWVYDHEPVLNSSLDAWNDKYQSVPALDLTPENNWLGEQQAQWQDGPFNLALYGLKSSEHWGTSGQLYIKTPVIDELRHNLSALEVFFRYPQVAENGDTGKSYYYQLKAKGYYMNGEFIMDKEKPYMEGQLSFNLPKPVSSQAQENPVTSINGDIIVHLPLSKHSSNFSDLSIGAQWEDEGVFAKIVRLANDVMEFEISGNRSRLLQLILYNADNKRISTSDVQQGFASRGGQQTDKIVVNYRGIPVKGEMTVSEGQQIRRYPFQLNLQ